MKYSNRLGIVLALVVVGSGSVGAPGCVGAADTADAVDEPVDEAQEALISTWYSGNSATRAVYARGPFKGTPRLRLTWKTWGTGSCNKAEYGMVPLPAWQITYSICASLGMQYTVSAGVNACVSASNSPPVGVFYYSWQDTWATQVNYRVIDQGINGKIENDSGWVPYAGNGCPR
jgi:hypothetical protein